jgi:Tfp pilus assembly protein PilN
VLKSNLATRPFYNERGVRTALVAIGVLVFALTLFNLVRFAMLSSQQSALDEQIARDEQAAASLMQSAARIRQSINQRELTEVSRAARDANAIIARRTFSWTELFNRIEETLPPDVMLTSVRPSFDKGTTQVSMTVVGRRVEDVDRFMEQLEQTRAFVEVLSTEEKRNDDGTYLVTLSGEYRRADAPPKSAAAVGLAEARTR